MVILLPLLICSLVTGLQASSFKAWLPHLWLRASLPSPLFKFCTHILSSPTIPDDVEFEGRLALVARAFQSDLTSQGRPTREPHLSTPPANVSQGRQPTAASLTAPAPAQSQDEFAVQHLLKVVRSDASGTRAAAQRRGPYAAGTHSFLSGNVPRDHHGRIAHKPGPLSLDEPGSNFEDDALTPTITASRRPQQLQWWRRVAVTTAGAGAQHKHSRRLARRM
ncbi:hypothetical protein EDB85DRAFT_2159583 [Lactarius pseudohatsudake]|nr:hypothetical protein EDB85DRAFT_2159583 [Lactarius pseudohatsudake]